MWFKIPVLERENPNERNYAVNAAIYRAIRMRKYYKDENLELKSPEAKRKALSRKIKTLLRQVKRFFFQLLNLF